MSTPVETEITPPEPDIDEDGDTPSGRLSVSWSDVDDAYYDAAVQLFGDPASDPERFADALLDAVLALASLRGSAYSWAVVQSLSRYDGLAAR